ncbi:unnamed protein product [Phyllotreta striolata]|uniref:Uncharacterized protein n=1 Tax=Phyllotreta striolata TaxID=444603 RepID=A0A9N9TFH0_PHYSR|nr:unnamed protein product [Phyllotreta striolata]
MTDVAPKTPNKRKSLADQKTPKKAKVENGLANKSPFTNSAKKPNQTPKPQKNQQSPKKPQMTPNKKNQSPNKKNQQTPKPLNNQNKGNKNTPAKNGKGAKVAPFKGTANLKKGNANVNVPKKAKAESGDKKDKKAQFYKVKLLMNSTNPEEKKAAVTLIDNKIKEIQNKGELTKTANRKIRILKKFRKIAEGTYVKPEPKVAKAKVEKKGQGEKQVQGKQQNKPGKQVKKGKQEVVKAEDDDEESDDEFFEEDGESGDEDSDDGDSSED